MFPVYYNVLSVFRTTPAGSRSHRPTLQGSSGGPELSDPSVGGSGRGKGSTRQPGPGPGADRVAGACSVPGLQNFRWSGLFFAHNIPEMWTMTFLKFSCFVLLTSIRRSSFSEQLSSYSSHGHVPGPVRNRGEGRTLPPTCLQRVLQSHG